jgi:hypothetical protein
MGIALCHPWFKFYHTEEFIYLLPILFPLGEIVNLEGFPDNISDTHTRVQGSIRVLIY